MEVIARKNTPGIWLFYLLTGIFVFIIGVLLFLLAIFSAKSQGISLYKTIWGLIVAAMGIALIAVGSVFLAKHSKLPAELIVREGETLRLPDGSVKISEIVNLLYRTQIRFGDSSSGTLVLFTAVGQHQIKYVRNLEQVQTRIIALMMHCRDENSKEKEENSHG